MRPTLLPALLLAACGGSDRLYPIEAPVLRDRLVFETGGDIGVMAPGGTADPC